MFQTPAILSSCLPASPKAVNYFRHDSLVEMGQGCRMDLQLILRKALQLILRKARVYHGVWLARSNLFRTMARCPRLKVPVRILVFCSFAAGGSIMSQELR